MPVEGGGGQLPQGPGPHPDMKVKIYLFVKDKIFYKLKNVVLLFVSALGTRWFDFAPEPVTALYGFGEDYLGSFV